MMMKKKLYRLNQSSWKIKLYRLKHIIINNQTSDPKQTIVCDSRSKAVNQMKIKLVLISLELVQQ